MFADLRKLGRRSPDGRLRAIVGFQVPDYEALRNATVVAKDARESTVTGSTLEDKIRVAANDVLKPQIDAQELVVHRIFRTIPFATVNMSEKAVDALESLAEVFSIQEDVLISPTLDDTTVIVGSDRAWDLGFDGSGTAVAVLDTGFRLTHQMFAGKTITEACFASGNGSSLGDCPNGQEEQIGPGAAALHPSNFDGFDHGTHVAGIAVGNGPIFDGVARGADLIAINVFSRVLSDSRCDRPGAPPPFSSCLLAQHSDIVAGLEQVFALRNSMTIASVNMSIGGNSFDDQLVCDIINGSMKAAIDNLVGARINVAVASGNDDACDGISFPACISSAIAVGATDDNDQETSFSNFHSTLLDIFAPGLSVMSAAATANNGYHEMSGTSMAAPHVAGALAIIRQAGGDQSVSIRRAVMILTAENVVSGRCDSTPPQGRLRVDQALLAASADTWVDFNNVGSETGTILAPFNTLTEGDLFTPAGGVLAFKPGSTTESHTFSKAMTLRAFGGSVTIGAQ
jgi:subtilisin family serine protease